jgi:hypothetical protein
VDYSISKTEGEQEEWKEAFNDVLLEEGLKTSCAFLNSFGGKIIFGVTRDGKPTRLACDIDEAQRNLFDKARAHLKPNASPFVNVRVYEDRLYLFVKSDPLHIYQYRGVIYKRTGSSTHSLTYEEAKALESQREAGVRKIAPGVFSRVAPHGGVLRCSNPSCGYSEIFGSASKLSIGGPPRERSCPRCGCVLTVNTG